MRFGKQWCLTAEQSLSFYSGNRIVPKQIIIRSPLASNNTTMLMHNTSIFDLKAEIADPLSQESQFGLNLYTLPEALIDCSPDFFKSDSIAARTCLSMVSDAADILRLLLDKGLSTKAGRLAGAFRNIGNSAAADEIVGTMKSLGYDVREEDPFAEQSILPYSRITYPYVMRLKLMWNDMREVVIKHFPATENRHSDIEACLAGIETQYKEDAYNSLSIEGYRVTDDLIEKVRSGNWKPDEDSSDAMVFQPKKLRSYSA